MSTEPVITAENSATQENVQATTAVIAEEKPQDVNWRKFREERALERKQKEDADKRAAEKEAEASALKAAMEALLSRNQTPTGQIHEEEDTEEQRIQKKIDAALLQREQHWDQERKRKEQAEFPQKLASTYSDFNQVCTTENLDYLEFHYPEVANAFKNVPDSFDKWSSIYKAVKRFIPNTNDTKDKKQAEKNLTKPQSMAVPGITQTGDNAPHTLDDKRRQDNWRRMQRIMKSGS